MIWNLPEDGFAVGGGGGGGVDEADEAITDDESVTILTICGGHKYFSHQDVAFKKLKKRKRYRKNTKLQKNEFKIFTLQLWALSKLSHQ